MTLRPPAGRCGRGRGPLLARSFLLVLPLASALAGCGGHGESTAIRLLEVAEAERQVETAGDHPAQSRPVRGFAGDAGSNGTTEQLAWKAGPGIEDLRLAGAELQGTAATGRGVLYLDAPFSAGESGLLESVEVRLRASAGSSIALALVEEANGDLGTQVAGLGPLDWTMRTPLIAGERLRTYRLSSPLPVDASRVRRILLRPTDRAGASFEVGSLRPIFRRQRLEGVPSGPGWIGLSEVYRPSLVARAPSRVSIPVTLPADPWLDLAVGTLAEGPLTFEVEVATASPAVRHRLRRTVTTPERWEPLVLDLSGLAGQRAEIRLSLRGDRGAVGFWGNPVVRGRPPARAGADVSGRPPQGVILIWADSLRRDHLEAYGYGRSTAPNVARLAREGTRFDDCIAQGSWTKVSTVSLLTSLYPSSHGVVDFSDRLPAAARTLAEVYRDAGYATLSMSSILLTGRFTGLHQGFDEVHESLSFPDTGSSKTARTYVDRLLPWLERYREEPFFVFLHLYDPHDPYRPETPYDNLWARADEARHEDQARRLARSIADPLLQRFGMPSRAELERAGLDPERFLGVEQDWYDGSIRGMDAEIGRLLERLEELGLAEETLVVFTSDHGEEFLDHGRTFHGQSVYGELIHVPLILWGARWVPRGAVVRETVELVDLMPTLLELSGLEAPPGLQGQSLSPLLAAPGATARSLWRPAPAFAEKPAVSELLAPPPRQTASRVVVAEGWKLIHHHRRPPGRPELELFDHRRDPLDQHDLAAERPELVHRLQRLLAVWQAEVIGRRVPGLPPPIDRALEPRGLERLRSLGYLAVPAVDEQ